ncbi:MAG: hypothetical protein U0R26_10120 [Solirubrobacterales bacterium]
MNDDTSGWAMGWATFAAIMLMLGGCFAILAGIAGIAEDDILVRTQDWVFNFDTTTWGWIHLLVGIGVVAAGFGIFSGNVAARTVGVIVAIISAVINFAWLPYYPVWAVVVIAIDIAVIWALTAHGRDLARDAARGA